MASQHAHGFPYGETRSRKNTERMVQQWHVQKDRLGQEGPRLTRKRRTAVVVVLTLTRII